MPVRRKSKRSEDLVAEAEKRLREIASSPANDPVKTSNLWVSYFEDEKVKAPLPGCTASAFRGFFLNQDVAVQHTKAPKGLLIDLLIPADRAEDMLLVLSTAYEERWLRKHGLRRARFIFFVQSSGAIVGHWVNWLKRHLDVFKLFAGWRPPTA